MNRPYLILLVCLSALPCLAGADGVAPGSLSYTVPAAPVSPDPANLLLRLIGLTAALLVLCLGVIWWARRSTRLIAAKGNASGRIVLEGSLTLDRRSAVHVIRVDGQSVAVTTDASGLRSIVILSEPFEQVLAESEERQAA